MNKFDQIQNTILANNFTIRRFMDRLESLVAETGDKKIRQLLEEEATSVRISLESLEANSKALHASLRHALAKHADKLKKRIRVLKHGKNTTVTDSPLREFKTNDLFQLTAELEHAYNTISAQVHELKEAHKEILQRNKELELQQESLLTHSGHLNEVSETITDIHNELKIQQKEILKKKKEFLGITSEKNNLIGIVAHDLKSPLNQIRGFINILKMNTANLDEDTIQVIRMIESSTVRLSDMVSKILNVDAIESDNPSISLKQTNLSALLETVTQRFKVEAAQKKITIHTHFDEDAWALADEDYADQVFQNLISNAIKFSPKGRNVFISLEDRGDQVICKVRDEGPGISSDDKKKLFGKYQRLSAKPTGGETSTGLGLSIVKRFVEYMNADIRCESEQESGACFIVSFPKQ